MRHLTIPGLVVLLTTVAASGACGGSTSSPASSGDGGGGGGSGGGSGGGGSGGSSGAGDDSGTPDEGGSTTPPANPVATNASFGTYIVLGDSISDRGGQSPFFYDLLHQNDDTTYPTWKGHDLATKFPGIQYVHAAVAGSITGSYNDALTKGAPLMSDQIAKLGNSYPGDILVTITIGGNDSNDHAGDAVLGLDTPQKQQLTANLKADLDALTAPGRLGSGKLYILEANIYDASDGQGDWKNGGGSCPGYQVSSSQDTTVFSAWNQIITDAITAHPGDYAFDIHNLFSGHGFNSKDNWYFTDCIHPNQKGHQQLRKEAWRLITGEVVE